MAEDRNSEAIIPEDDFREAIAACCLDPLLKRYFTMAPSGAKLFIGLGFYSTHFGDRVDPKQYAECQAEIEPALTVNDLNYLIRFEEDRNTKQYLRRLLAQRQEEEPTDVAPQEPPPQNEHADPIPLPRRKKKRNAITVLSEVTHAESMPRLQLAWKVAALVAILLGVTVLVYANRSREEDGRLDVAETMPPVVKESVSSPPATAQRSPASTPIKGDDQPAEQNAETSTAETVAWTPAETEHGKASPAGEQPMPDVAQSAPAETNVVAAMPQPQKKMKRAPRVVFTNGRKIVRHMDGSIEVPRVFSSIGAGVKPFWVYSSNTEREAELERKARREWQELFNQAKQTEQCN